MQRVDHVWRVQGEGEGLVAEWCMIVTYYLCGFSQVKTVAIDVLKKVDQTGDNINELDDKASKHIANL